MKSESIGLFGGSFNPIHAGHVALAKALREHYGLDEVWLMVSPQNPLKQYADLLDDHLRLEMARLALQDVEGIMASDYEFHLPKPSYTWNTLQSLRRDYPDRTFILLMGGDNWARFSRWYHWKDILRNYEVRVYPREIPGTPAEPPFKEEGRRRKDEGERTKEERRGCFSLINISSTDIRRRIRQGEPIDGLVPDAVARFIKERHLYED